MLSLSPMLLEHICLASRSRYVTKGRRAFWRLCGNLERWSREHSKCCFSCLTQLLIAPFSFIWDAQSIFSLWGSLFIQLSNWSLWPFFSVSLKVIDTAFGARRYRSLNASSDPSLPSASNISFEIWYPIPSDSIQRLMSSKNWYWLASSNGPSTAAASSGTVLPLTTLS